MVCGPEVAVGLVRDCLECARKHSGLLRKRCAGMRAHGIVPVCCLMGGIPLQKVLDMRVQCVEISGMQAECIRQL